MTASEAAKLVALLMQAYPQAQCAPATSAMYERMLSDLDVAEATAAVERLIRTTKWFPSIAEIRSVAAELKHGPRRLGAEAWGDVVESMRRVGAYKPAPQFRDPLVGEAVRLFGWRSLCHSENSAADRARFIEVYDGLKARERTEIIASKHLELPEKQNPVRGLLAKIGMGGQ